MKFVMSLVLAATFATPAFASEKDGTTTKNQAEIKKVVAAAKKNKVRDQLIEDAQFFEDATRKQELNAEEERGANAYRLTEVQDPNAEKASKTEKSVTVRPWTGSNRKRILTPEEMRREEEQGKYSTFTGSEVGLKYKTVYGAKATIKFGGAKQ